MAKNRFEIIRQRARRYVERYDSAFVTGYMKDECREEAARIVASANRLMSRTFVFDDKWDMEPCRKAYTLNEMVWDKSPNGDPEWVYMLNRHEYLHKLLLAYRLTGQRAYVDRLKWYLSDWIRQNPILPKGRETTRTIDTGIRCMAWQRILIHLIGEGLMEEAEARPVLESMGEQVVNLAGRYIPKYTLSNWGVLQTTAICQGSLWFGEYLPDGVEKAWEELRRQLSLQVMGDGSHWEQSIMYHMEVLLACMKLMEAWGGEALEPFGETGRQVRDSWLGETVRNMSLYALHAAAPDGRQLAQCDSDVTDTRDVMVKAAVLTGDGCFRFCGYESMDLDSAWLFGRKGITAYRTLKARRPASRSYHAADTGNLYFRSGWEKDAHFTYLTCGPLGSGHGHADMTHISLHYQGKPFLVDSGRYSYREDEPLRPLLKSAQSHNVCVIDHESHGIPNGSWSYDRYGECLKNYYREEGPVHYGEMAYHSRLSSGENCLVVRKTAAVDDGIWLIVDKIYCDGSHLAEAYYHLDSHVTADKTVEEGAGQLWVLENSGSKLKLQGSGEFEKRDCVISPRYNEKEESVCLVKRTRFTGETAEWTALWGQGIRMEEAPVYQYGRDQPAPESMVIAKKWVLSDRESWTLLIWNGETFQGGKLYLCGQTPIYGKAAAIHEEEGEITLYPLRN